MELSIPSDLDSVDGVIAQSLLVGDLETAVDLCFADDRLADALALASAGTPALALRTRQRYFEEKRKKAEVSCMGGVRSSKAFTEKETKTRKMAGKNEGRKKRPGSGMEEGREESFEEKNEERGEQRKVQR